MKGGYRLFKPTEQMRFFRFKTHLVSTRVNECKEECVDLEALCSCLLHFFFLLRDKVNSDRELTNFVSSLRTIVYVKFSSEVIATAAIYMAARMLQIPLPESPAWWELFDATKARKFATAILWYLKTDLLSQSWTRLRGTLRGCTIYLR
jgi:hypothetical protein